MFYSVYEQRKQVRWYDQDRTPSKELIDKCLVQTYELVASKQNLMPYKVYVIDNNRELNQALYDISQEALSTKSANYNLLTAPYQFVYTVRLAGGNSKVDSDVNDWGHSQPPMNPDQYKTRETIKNTNIEIGMHATILSKLLIENGVDVSYTLCFPNWEYNQELWHNKGFTFIEDEVQFIMSAGYDDPEKYFDSPESKPDYDTVVQWN